MIERIFPVLNEQFSSLKSSVRSLFVSFRFVRHRIVDTETNTAVTQLKVCCSSRKTFYRCNKFHIKMSQIIFHYTQCQLYRAFPSVSIPCFKVQLQKDRSLLIDGVYLLRMIHEVGKAEVANAWTPGKGRVPVPLSITDSGGSKCDTNSCKSFHIDFLVFQSFSCVSFTQTLK